MRWCALLAMLTLVACKPAADPDKERADENARRFEAAIVADRKALDDPAKASAVIESGVRKHVSNDGDYLLISPLSENELYLVKPDFPWTVRCGYSGMNLIFGNPIMTDENGPSNELSFFVTLAHLTPRECRELSPKVGETLHAIAMNQ